jgi:phage terminase large subunit-like protein
VPRKKVLTEKDQQREEHRVAAESSLEYFITLVHPRRCLGSVHREVIQWWTRPEANRNQMLLLPRDHMKSTLLAYRLAWELTKDPTLRILLISSTSNLATKQLKFIKDILTSPNYRIFWPDMVEKEEAKREKWTEREISVDHPDRKKWNIRDPSVFTAGLTSNIVGLHCDIAAMDDIVVDSNAYVEAGRTKVQEQYGYLSSVESVGAREWVVGTRYHPKDLYSDLINMEIQEFDELGNVAKASPLFEVFERQVESIGDGTGEFLWPRQQGQDGKWFGFDQQILAEKRGKYTNKVHFRAQYYNDPHDIESSAIKREEFQYYDPCFVNRKNGRWYFKDELLNVVAAVDFAYSLGKKADYTAIAVVGVDGRMNYYILDIDRFRADKPSEYFNKILKLFEKWGFRKIRAEVSAAQAVIVKDLKESYIRPLGLSLSVEEYRPSRWQGSKEERILAVLEPKYSNRQIWHYVGGHCQSLEDELIFTNPAHDDIKDALASAIDFAIAPQNIFSQIKKALAPVTFHSKYGGVS